MPKSLAGKLGVAAGVTGLAFSLYDAAMGAIASQDWGVDKISGAIGGMFGGTGKGMMNAVSKAGQWAGIGWMAGIPFGPIGMIVGGLVGGALGAVAGYFGGEAVAQAFEKMKQWFGQHIDSIFTAFKEKFIDLKDKILFFIDGNPIARAFGTELGGSADELEAKAKEFEKEAEANKQRLVDMTEKINSIRERIKAAQAAGDSAEEHRLNLMLGQAEYEREKITKRNEWLNDKTSQYREQAIEVEKGFIESYMDYGKKVLNFLGISDGFMKKMGGHVDNVISQIPSWDDIKTAGTNFKDTMIEKATELKASLTRKANTMYDKIFTKMKEYVPDSIDLSEIDASGMASTLTNKATALYEKVSSKIKGWIPDGLSLGEIDLVDIKTTVVNKIKDVTNQIRDSVLGILSKIGQWFSENFDPKRWMLSMMESIQKSERRWRSRHEVPVQSYHFRRGA